MTLRLALSDLIHCTSLQFSYSSLDWLLLPTLPALTHLQISTGRYLTATQVLHDLIKTGLTPSLRRLCLIGPPCSLVTAETWKHVSQCLPYLSHLIVPQCQTEDNKHHDIGDIHFPSLTHLAIDDSYPLCLTWLRCHSHTLRHVGFDLHIATLGNRGTANLYNALRKCPCLESLGCDIPVTELIMATSALPRLHTLSLCHVDDDRASLEALRSVSNLTNLTALSLNPSCDTSSWRRNTDIKCIVNQLPLSQVRLRTFKLFVLVPKDFQCHFRDLSPYLTSIQFTMQDDTIEQLTCLSQLPNLSVITLKVSFGQSYDVHLVEAIPITVTHIRLHGATAHQWRKFMSLTLRRLGRSVCVQVIDDCNYE